MTILNKWIKWFLMVQNAGAKIGRAKIESGDRKPQPARV